MDKRIGLILATIHEGASIRLLRSALNSVDLLSDSVVILPGGRLNYRGQDEYLRNSIYSLADGANFDGIISWTSSLTGEMNTEEVCSLMRGIRIPFVSIGLPVDGSPSVTFNAYEGMYKETEHFILKHGIKRIAFLRGPQNHASAESRFSAYEDCLKQYGIPFCADLVSAPMAWNQGREALREIICDRGLVPGIDFDALICASDLMLSGALKYLEEINVDVPHTLKVAGFNDSDNNKIMKVAPTTVRMPVVSMCHVAVELIHQLLNDPNTTVEDVILPAELVIRHSCGCRHSFGSNEPVSKDLANRENFISWIISLTQDQISYQEVKAFIDYAFDVERTMKDGELSRFRDRFIFFVRRFLQSGGELYDLLDVYKCFLYTFGFPENFLRFCESELIPSMINTYSRVDAEHKYQLTQQNGRINRLKNRLLSTRSIRDLGAVLRDDLPKVGIKQGYMVFATPEEGRSRLETGFTVYGELLPCESFDSALLLPEHLKKNISRGAHIVLPLTYDSEYLGYFLCDITDQRDEQMLEELRCTLSSTLKGISLLDAANRAKDAAEKAERASTDFFDNISDGLKEPLSQMKKLLLDSEMPEKKELLNHLMKAEHLLDLCYTEKGQMELQRKLIAPTAFFRELAKAAGIPVTVPDALPAVYADPERLAQAVEIILQLAEPGSSGYLAEVSIKPVGLMFFVKSDYWNPARNRGDASLALAEKIVMMLGGSFHFKDHGIQISMPWPSLTSEVTQSGAIGYTLYIRKDEAGPVPAVVNTLPQVLFVTENELAEEFDIPENVTRLAWNYAEKRERESVVLNLLRNHQRSKSLPFLCFDMETSTLDLWSALRTGSGENIDGTILVLGTLPKGLHRLSAFGSFVNVTDAGKLTGYGKTPAMIILNAASHEVVSSVRREKEFAKVPILLVKDHFDDVEVEKVAQLPNLLICNTCLCESDEFVSRLIGIFGGNAVLPPLTGALVKRAIGFLNRRATSQISRWQLAEYVNISEDYLTRIFKKDMGLSPWDYLNRYRVQLATELLTQTGSTINEVAAATGFQDQAYFCRVFKKIMGVSPGQMRNRG